MKPPGCFVVQLEAWTDAVDEQQRQRDIIGDAFGAQVVDDRKALACGIVDAGATSCPCWNTMVSGLAWKSGDSRMLKSTVPTSTSAPGFQMKLRPKMSGCRVRTKTPTRHSGRPAATIRSQDSAIIRVGLVADRAPSISQSVELLQFRCIHDAGICRASSARVKATRTLDVAECRPV